MPNKLEDVGNDDIKKFNKIKELYFEIEKKENIVDLSYEDLRDVRIDVQNKNDAIRVKNDAKNKISDLRKKVNRIINSSTKIKSLFKLFDERLNIFYLPETNIVRNKLNNSNDRYLLISDGDTSGKINDNDLEEYNLTLEDLVKFLK